MKNQLDLTFKQHDNYLEILLRDPHYVRIKRSVEEGAPMYEFYILESLVQDIRLNPLYLRTSFHKTRLNASASRPRT